MENLLNEIRNCTICQSHLKDGFHPVLTAHQNSKIAVVGQAPGRLVHESGIPWDDQSGERLRSWLGVDKPTFVIRNNLPLYLWDFAILAKGSRVIYHQDPNVLPNGILNFLKN